MKQKKYATNNKKYSSDNTCVMELVLPENTCEADVEIKGEILEVLKTTKFNKISIPLNTYRKTIDHDLVDDDGKVTTIGYIKDYDAENKKFTVIVFNKYIDLFKDVKCSIELAYTTYKDHLGTITKFIANMNDSEFVADK